MSEYAVVNPATGETVARYARLTDAQVEQALAYGRGGVRDLAEAPGRRARRGWSAGRPSCIGNAGRNWPPSSSARWAR